MPLRPKEVDIEDLRAVMGPFVDFSRQQWAEVAHGCKNTRFQVTPFRFIRPPLADLEKQNAREPGRLYFAFHHKGEFYIEPARGDDDTPEAAVSRVLYAEET